MKVWRYHSSKARLSIFRIESMNINEIKKIMVDLRDTDSLWLVTVVGTSKIESFVFDVVVKVIMFMGLFEMLVTASVIFSDWIQLKYDITRV